MRSPVLDQTNLEESFFFCEYAKRRFEMSNDNNERIQWFIESVGEISSKVYARSIPEGMQLDLLSNAIFCRESDTLGLQRTYSLEGSERHIDTLSFLPYIEYLLTVSKRFKVNAAFLPFPYDMVEICAQTKCDGDVPVAFKMLKKHDMRCIIVSPSDNDYVYFGVDKNLQLNAIIDMLVEQATLFKSSNDYENCMRSDVLNKIHRKSNLKTHRQSLHNTFYKSSGLLIYDLYISNNFKIDRALEEYRKLNPLEKCDPAKKATSEDCATCKYFGECESNWRKHFKAAVEKISGTEESESYLNRIRDNAQVKLLKRQPISFFEYQFNGTVK